MKKYINIKILSVFLLLMSSCVEEILDKAPLDRYAEELVWSDINLANSYLNTAYRNISSGFNSNLNLAGVSDHTFFIHIYGTDVYVQGNITPSNMGPFNHTRFRFLNWQLFDNIQIINTFLENIDTVVENTQETEREAVKIKAEILKGEALFLRAFAYAQMVRTFGGLPILTAPFGIGDDYLGTPRGSFEETIDFIVQDCDNAANLLLSKNEMEMGRATKGAALALKSRVLLFAASDLTADGTAENKYVGYENPDRTALWTAAKNAAKAVMELNTYSLADFGAPDKEAVANNYYDFFRQRDLSNNEIIWGKMFVADVGERHRNNLWQGPNGLSNYGSNNPTQDLVDTYQMDDGSSFSDHFTLDENGYYQNISDKYQNENPYYHREPRFYGSILYDSAHWQPRFSDLQERDPLGIYDRRTRITIQGGNEVSSLVGIDTRQGPVHSWNAGYTGYLMKKMMDHEVIGKDQYNENVWIWLRYAEIILNYAEASLELGDTQEAATYINMIRNRAGMPDFTGDIEEALRYEREIEFTFENIRWFDIRRWKILEEKLDDAKGIEIVETRNLDEGTVNTIWRRLTVQDRTVHKKMYWIPIPNDEMNKAPHLVQNPGY
ncbi:RagB/SusD family nutrient uptake outer membrane protein [Cyclobacterium marinum]|uniref:RagB/SusD domain-containing protein n=1 Tax=Cyclobacterium marinum (strain ATCC 25205 / DSM 745 / LMG 13164 / NCIMB 1802) TaxID=880070 RepID=G0IYA7_CYCMS|nr:RagB/SusD family nutrient uptake outer membrane protein [Cyclobacterium marinum]AEL25642.1 RagB/SusD domain-containing protein [Cyclobacterium marinum DSM 745]MBI0401072.1 RagB/SusD family nutrient uptake outer membrane protein [Cyclobacterium marinum]